MESLTVAFKAIAPSPKTSDHKSAIIPPNPNPTMNLSPTAREIQAKLSQLSLSEQTWLMEYLAQQIRQTLTPQPDWTDDLTVMAADPQIQAELAAIDAEFAPTEMDGLA
ncbi:hypothetical protein [Spirulina major]|uniref:hypothetical protein n=1 Tax=Spirulina major TaxID=270636 RepID=UPI001C31E00C|nr:hypothetical protein [Spirulina major]